MSLWGLAEVVDGSRSSGVGAAGSVYALAVLLAAGYAVRPELVGAGLGILGTVTLLLGRYTGYRLTELYRFGDLIKEEPTGEGRS